MEENKLVAPLFVQHFSQNELFYLHFPLLGRLNLFSKDMSVPLFVWCWVPRAGWVFNKLVN